MKTRTRMILIALFVAVLIVLFLWVDAGITWFKAESRNQGSSGTAVAQGSEYQPSWEVVLEVRGEAAELVRALKRALDGGAGQG